MKINVAILLLLTSFKISAQELKKFDFRVGFGPTIEIPNEKSYGTKSGGYPYTSYKPGFGYFVGLLMTYHLNTNWGLQSGFDYVQNRLSITDEIGLIETTGNIKTAYGQIPIMVQYSFREASPLTFSAGTYLGILINASQKGTSILDTAALITPPGEPVSIEPKSSFNNDNKFNFNDDIKSNFKDLDLGLSLEIDYELNFNARYSAIIFTRFNYGLVDAKSEYLLSHSKYSINTWRNIGLLVGFGVKM